MKYDIKRMEARAVSSPVDAYWHGAIIDTGHSHAPTVRRCQHDHRRERTALACAEKMFEDYKVRKGS